LSKPPGGLVSKLHLDQEDGGGGNKVGELVYEQALWLLKTAR